MSQDIITEQGFSRLMNLDEHEKALATYNKSLQTEENWKRLVEEGKARCIKTPVIGGWRYHYELI